ncbi:antitoxin [Streptomyces sp. NPDC088789]|uniref:antitoxin n=1 Tax=Streptomyces sp. NPDC088789 TaxID=3365899 RepID=UPI0038219A57
MGLLDNLKAKLTPAKDKVSDLAQQHGGKIQQGIDKAAQAVDERTKGKYSDKIHTGTDKAKGAMDRLAHKDGGPEGTAPGQGGTGPTGTNGSTGPTGTTGTTGSAGPAGGTGPGSAGPGGGTTPPDSPPPAP